MNYRHLISPGSDGVPCVKRSQVRVADVLGRLASGSTEGEILVEFPTLTSEDIHACIAFANDHISRVRDVIAQDPSAEVWKYLRFFLDEPATAAIIRDLHQVPDKTQTRNINKQAQQIGFCIRQAEQYFRASAQVGLPTRPVLLYYGAVSLSQALILLRWDGRFSLDERRKERRHNHHGLELKRGLAEQAARSRTLQGFLEKVECYCHTNEGRLWGLFPLFYESLVPQATTIPAQIFTSQRASFLEHNYVVDCADMQPVEMVGQLSLNAWELFRGLPDLYFSLTELGVEPNLCRGSIKRQVTRFVSPRKLNAGTGDPNPPGPAQNIPPDRVQFLDSFFVDGITASQKTTLLDLYHKKNSAIKVVDDYGPNLYLQLTAEGSDEREIFLHMGYYPDVAEDISGMKYYIVEPGKFIPEPASILALLFCFSMLCRYYPDVWMKGIDQDVRLAEITNEFLNIAHRKLPNLILDQLTLTKHTIHQ